MCLVRKKSDLSPRAGVKISRERIILFAQAESSRYGRTTARRASLTVSGSSYIRRYILSIGYGRYVLSLLTYLHTYVFFLSLAPIIDECDRLSCATSFLLKAIIAKKSDCDY